MNALLRLRITLLVAAGLALAGRATAVTMEPFCARTPELAIRAAQSSMTSDIAAQKDGYRLSGVRWDPLLNQQWATITTCGHPDRPAIALPFPGLRRASMFSSSLEGLTNQSPFPVVHAGDLVQLWGQQKNLRVEAAGRAEQSGATGSKVRVRLLRSGLEGGQPQMLVGIVRGPGNVEIQP